ncbi:MAG: hypothetical protein ACRDHN_20175 [Thermomicrobiales bacterium]
MNVHPLTPIENDIIVEICRFLAVGKYGHALTGDVIEILGCWGDTLPEEIILKFLREINSHAYSDQ